MATAILRIKDRETWDRTRTAVGGGVYHSAAYHAAYEAADCVAEAFVYREGEAILFHPYMRRPVSEVAGHQIEQGLCDIESVYGYTGPLATNTDEQFIESAWRSFGQHCAAQGIVAEFVRFDCFRANHTLFGQSGQIIEDRPTVVIPLGDGSLWDSYPPVQRNRLRKAKARGLKYECLEPAEGLEVFTRRYKETMARAGAAEWYFFNDVYFENLFEGLGPQASMAVVKDKDDIVAAAIFLHDGEMLHYHLGASSKDALEFAPNNWLFHNAALAGAERGQKWLHLGGGRTPAHDDSLLRFKRTFSRRERIFRTGRRIHLQDAFDGLCARWMSQMNVKERPQYFLLYRL